MFIQIFEKNKLSMAASGSPTQFQSKITPDNDDEYEDEPKVEESGPDDDQNIRMLC